MNILPIIIMNLILIVIAILLAIADYFLASHRENKIIINGDKILTSSSDDSLLNVLSSNKIFVPSACGGKSTCGHCKIKVLSGGGNALPTEEVFLTTQEKLSGTRLACQVKMRNDIEVYLPESLLSVQEYTSTAVEMADLTHDIKFLKLKLDLPQKIEFKPGQYVQIKIPGVDEFRAYSIASHPGSDNSIEFSIRLVHKGLCSTYIHKVLKVGDRVCFTGPYGEFFLQEENDRDIICIAGGCGMAPIRSILYHLKEKNMPRKIVYFFGARTKSDLFYTDELNDLEKQFPNFKYVPALSEPKPDDKWTGETGLITQVVERYIDSTDKAEAYLCGPPPMIDAAIKVLTRKGMKEENIYFDKF